MNMQNLKNEFGKKFYEGLYPCIPGAVGAEDIWNWIEKNFTPKINFPINNWAAKDWLLENKHMYDNPVIKHDDQTIYVVDLMADFANSIYRKRNS